MADKRPLSPLVVIDDGLVTSMAANAEFVRTFAFLKNVKDVRAGGCNCARRTPTATTTFDTTKRTLAQMDDTLKRKLKEMLRAIRVRIIYRNNSNQIVSVTF